MLTLSAVCPLLIATSLLASAQSNPTRIAGVDEPPELTWEPKKLTPVSDTLRDFSTIMNQWSEHDTAKIRALRPALDAFIQQHPAYSDAYTVRGMGDLCYLKNKNYSRIASDITTAIGTHSPAKGDNMFDLSDLYGIRAKTQYLMGRYQDAMADLETAVNQNIDSADKVFMSQGTKPDTSDAILWSQSDIDNLVQRFPKDYRSYLFRGLYFHFYATFSEMYYQQSMQEFQKANALNPRSRLPYYYMGHLHTQSSMWSKAAWTSDDAKFEDLRKAAQQYTKAIEVDPRFLPAYELRAMSYLNLKQSRLAINDYDRILELDSENGGAESGAVYHDRALAKMDLNQYRSAMFDLDEAIRRSKPNDNQDSMMYENLADCQMKVGEYRDAIFSLSKAIERQLAAQSLSLNIREFRALYPEYANVSDQAICSKLSTLFWPQFQYADFAHTFLREHTGEGFISMLAELYEKRGDSYLRTNDFRRAVNDFNRIYRGIPSAAESLDRWRSLGATSDGDEFYVDIKTIEFAASGTARLWMKTIGKKSTHTVDAYEIDCKVKHLNHTSSVVYATNGNVLSSSGESSGWQQIIPETIGEQLYNGVCR
jgi:tetratricopeptide (TPR) repeat protein